MIVRHNAYVIYIQQTNDAYFITGLASLSMCQKASSIINLMANNLPFRRVTEKTRVLDHKMSQTSTFLLLLVKLLQN